MSRSFTRRAAALLAVAAGGCIGNIRETTSPRTATEMLLISTAAQRAVMHFDPLPMRGKRVFLDMSNFDSIDKGYVISALRDHLAGAGVILADKADAEDTEVVLEVRNGALGLYDGAFTLGIPQLPVSAQGFPPVLLPPLYVFHRDTAQGWAKFDFWTYDPRTKRYLSRHPGLWGSAFYNQWYIFGIGPFDGSNDIYPDWDLDRFLESDHERPPAEAPFPQDGEGQQGQGEGEGD